MDKEISYSEIANAFPDDEEVIYINGVKIPTLNDLHKNKEEANQRLRGRQPHLFEQDVTR